MQRECISAVFLPYFTIELLLYVASPFFSFFFFFFALELILIGSERPPRKSFFCFKENFFFWRQSLFSHNGTSHMQSQDTCCLNRSWWSYVNRIRASTTLSIKNFFFLLSPHFATFEPPNNNRPKKIYAILMGPEKLLYMVFSVLEDIPSFCGCIISLKWKLYYKNPKKLKAILKRTGKPYWITLFKLTENLLSWLNHPIESFVPNCFLNTNFPTTEIKFMTTQ